MNLVAPLIRYDIEPDQGRVVARLAGGFASRAVYLGADGCRLVSTADATGSSAHRRHADSLPAGPGSAPAGTDASTPVDPGEVARRTADPGLTRTLDLAFAPDPADPARLTQAVVIRHHGKIVAERYAPGVTPTTPLLGFSMSKSVTSALAGLVIADGRLTLETPVVPGPATGDKATIADALRMTTGLDLNETGSGFDPSNRMLYVAVDDMAAYARQAPAVAHPGTRWAYSTASTQLVMRKLADALGGPESLLRYAENRLFRPLGLQSVVMESDETGTPIGGHYMLASARDWSRFGQLYLDRGIGPGGDRLLPDGWIDWSTEPTLTTDYGAGWWLNRRAGEGPGPGNDMPLLAQAPADTFYGLGNLGQWLVVVPSHDLVIVKIGLSHTADYDASRMAQVIGAAIHRCEGRD